MHGNTTGQAERRTSFRMKFNRRKNSRVKLCTDFATSVEAQLVDVGVGGLCCVIPEQTLHTLQPDQTVDRIVVQPSFADHPLVCAGTIRRLAPAKGRRGTACAIEFGAIYAGELPASETDHAPERQPADSPTSVFETGYIRRLQKAPDFSRCRSQQQRAQKRDELHTAFADVVRKLPAEYRWWFYYVLDSLKSAGARYQKGILAEYLKLCKLSAAV